MLPDDIISTSAFFSPRASRRGFFLYVYVAVQVAASGASFARAMSGGRCERTEKRVLQKFTLIVSLTLVSAAAVCCILEQRARRSSVVIREHYHHSSLY